MTSIFENTLDLLDRLEDYTTHGFKQWGMDEAKCLILAPIKHYVKFDTYTIDPSNFDEIREYMNELDTVRLIQLNRFLSYLLDTVEQGD